MVHMDFATDQYDSDPEDPAPVVTLSAEARLELDRLQNGDPNPFETPEYEAFMVAVAKDCRAEVRPCPGCCAGGMCDGDFHAVDLRDAVDDEREDWEDDTCAWD